MLDSGSVVPYKRRHCSTCFSDETIYRDFVHRCFTTGIVDIKCRVSHPDSTVIASVSLPKESLTSYTAPCDPTRKLNHNPYSLDSSFLYSIFYILSTYTCLNDPKGAFVVDEKIQLCVSSLV